jgi:hypothetical protein
MGDPKIVERGVATRFTPGNAPIGGRKHTRDRLNAAFIRDLTEAWEEKGKRVLDELADKDPASFARIAASLQPKEVELKVEPESGMSDERLTEVYGSIQAELEKRKSQQTVN